jgi:WD40 repeat protein
LVLVVDSPDGKRIVTASSDKTARIWDASTGKEIAVLRGHEDVLLSAAFSPTSARIVTGANDETARIWDAASSLRGNLLLRPVELGSVDPYAVQNYRELARDGDCGLSLLVV